MVDFPFEFIEQFGTYVAPGASGPIVDVTPGTGWFTYISPATPPVISVTGGDAYDNFTLPYGRGFLVSTGGSVAGPNGTSNATASHGVLGGSVNHYLCSRYLVTNLNNAIPGVCMTGAGFTGNGDPLFGVNIGQLGDLRVYINGSFYKSFSPGKFHNMVWYFIELYHINQSPGADRCVVWVNGEQIMDETVGGNLSTIDRVGMFRFGAGTLTNTRCYITDMGYAKDISTPKESLLPLRDVVFARLLCDADTAQQDWLVQGIQDAFETLGNIPPSLTNFIYAENVGDISEFEVDDLPPNILNVYCVVHKYKAAKEDEGPAEVQGSILIPSQSVTMPGSGFGLSLSFDYRNDFYYINPNTTAAFTPAEVDDMQLKYERTV